MNTDYQWFPSASISVHLRFHSSEIEGARDGEQADISPDRPERHGRDDVPAAAGSDAAAGGVRRGGEEELAPLAGAAGRALYAERCEPACVDARGNRRRL